MIKKRKQSTKPANLSKLEEKFLKACYPNKDKWSNQRYKDHCRTVLAKVSNTIQTECMAKGFVDRKDGFCLEVARVALVTVLNNLDRGGVSGMGYISSQADTVAAELKVLITASASTLSPQQREAHSAWLLALHRTFSEDYSIKSFHGLAGRVLPVDSAQRQADITLKDGLCAHLKQQAEVHIARMKREKEEKEEKQRQGITAPRALSSWSISDPIIKKARQKEEDIRRFYEPCRYIDKPGDWAIVAEAIKYHPGPLPRHRVDYRDFPGVSYESRGKVALEIIVTYLLNSDPNFFSNEHKQAEGHDSYSRERAHRSSIESPSLDGSDSGLTCVESTPTSLNLKQARTRSLESLTRSLTLNF